MKSNTTALKYYDYLKRTIILVLLPWLVALVYLLTREENETFNVLFIVIPAVVSVIIALAMSFARKVYIGSLIAVEVDFDSVYELEKRSEKHKAHNLKLLINTAFYNGKFHDVVGYADELMETSGNHADVFFAKHKKILSLFLLETDVDSLIEEQMNENNTLLTEEVLCYYNFIESFSSNKFDYAISSMEKALTGENIEIQNHKKVLIYYLMKLAYLKNEDNDNANKCMEKLLLADKAKRTIFSRE